MKQLPVKSPSFQYVERAFKEWLDVLGYADQSVYSMPNYIRELFFFLEKKGKREVKDITPELIRNYYYDHLKSRGNTRRGGGLGNNHLNKHLQALYKFTDYLRQSGRMTMAPLNIKWEERGTSKVAVFTEGEIRQLYKACELFEENSAVKPPWFYQALCLRDRAMLTVFYGCGLRRTEGISLDLSDILWEKELLYVRKGKNYKERFVPLSKSGLKHLETYIYDGRPLLLRSNKEDALFISERGERMQGQTMILRLHLLIARTLDIGVIEKQAGLHTLRHSIATHLLANGMKLEKIKDFLGHDSLESTQIYTHLLEKEILHENINQTHEQIPALSSVPL